MLSRSRGRRVQCRPWIQRYWALSSARKTNWSWPGSCDVHEVGELLPAPVRLVVRQTVSGRPPIFAPRITYIYIWDQSFDVYVADRKCRRASVPSRINMLLFAVKFSHTFLFQDNGGENSPVLCIIGRRTQPILHMVPDQVYVYCSSRFAKLVLWSDENCNRCPCFASRSCWFRSLLRCCWNSTGNTVATDEGSLNQKQLMDQSSMVREERKESSIFPEERRKEKPWQVLESPSWMMSQGTSAALIPRTISCTSFSFLRVRCLPLLIRHLCCESATVNYYHQSLTSRAYPQLSIISGIPSSIPLIRKLVDCFGLWTCVRLDELALVLSEIIPT